MKNFYSGIRGDFSISAISMRLYAPNPKALLKVMPDANEEQSLENWEKFIKKIDIKSESQSILYVANFVHEFVHLLQHTTLYQCIGQVDYYHKITWSILSLLQSFKTTNINYPPQVPLLDWLAKIEDNKGKEIFELCITGNLMFELYLGNELAAKHFCDTINRKMDAIFTIPFNPRIKFLDSNLDSFNDLSITTRMLLESQATLISYRFIASFFGVNFASEFIINDDIHSGNLRIDYDVLPLIAFADDMLYLMPLIIDWAFEGSKYLDYQKNNIRHPYFHPPWRFAKLYKAAKIFKRKNNLSKINIFDLLADPSKLKNDIFQIAEIEPDDYNFLLNSINQIDNEILKKIFKKNIGFKIEHPEAYSYFESNFSLIGGKTYAPITFFRDNPYYNFHCSSYNPQEDILDATRLSFFTRRAFELNRMIEGFIPKCPFCEGLEYKMPNGRTEKFYPPAGQRGVITKEMIISRSCNCNWAWEFKDYWGFIPEEIKVIN